MTGRRRRRHPPRWVPNQHGAWAMLVVPFVLGAILRLRSGEPTWFLLPLFACWLIGYIAFYNASGWLKAPRTRRHQWGRATVIAGGISATFGVATLSLAGPAMLWWALPYSVAMAAALALAARRRERTVFGGLLTTVVACLLTGVARFPNPRDFVGSPDATPTVTAAVIALWYFFGTVLYVKTNLRERGNERFYLLSVGYHVAGFSIAGGMAVFEGLSLWWVYFSMIAAGRAGIVPRWMPPLSVARIGLIEVGMSALLVIVFLLPPPG